MEIQRIGHCLLLIHEMMFIFFLIDDRTMIPVSHWLNLSIVSILCALNTKKSTFLFRIMQFVDIFLLTFWTNDHFFFLEEKFN